VLVIRSRIGVVPTAIGLLPLFVLLAGGIVLFFIVAMNGG